MLGCDELGLRSDDPMALFLRERVKIKTILILGNDFGPQS